MITGKLKYKEIDCLFAFDRIELKMIPKNNTSLLARKEICKGVYTDAEALIVDQPILKGQINENGRTIVFILSKGDYFDSENEVLSIKPLAYYEFNMRYDKVNRLIFKNQEMDLIYPVSEAYQICFQRDQEADNSISVKTKSIGDCKTSIQRFTFHDREIKVYFTMSRVFRTANRIPVEFSSSLCFEFEETDDYWSLYLLTIVALQFVQFLCGRQNVMFDEVDLSCKLGDRMYDNCADLYLLRDIEKDDYDSVKKHFIPYTCFEGAEGSILQMISDDTLYLRSLPESYKQGRMVTAATFVMTTAAFEWEFRKLFPEGIPKKEKTIKAEQNVCKILDDCIDKSTGEARSILKYYRKHVGDDYLAGEILYACEALNDIIKPFGDSMYQLNEEVLDYSEMSKRIAEQRNDFAHGNLDKDFLGLALLDISFLPMVVYAMQLSRAGVSNKEIRDAINALFHMNLFFEDDNCL